MSNDPHVAPFFAAPLAALLSFACHGDRAQARPPVPDSGQPAAKVASKSTHDAGSVGSSPPSYPPSEPATGSELPSRLVELRGTLEKRVRALAAALASNDRERFARGLFYPVRVNTRSWCSASFANPNDFVRHFDGIMAANIRRALRQPLVQMGGRGAMLGNGDVWFTDPNFEPITAFNSDVWELKGVPCDGWQLEALPSWLGGTWRVASVAEVQGTLDPNPPTQWDDGWVRVDLEHATVDVALRKNNADRCKPLRFGHQLEEPELRGVDAASNGFKSALGKPYFLDLECSNRGKAYCRRIDVLERALLALPGNDGFFVFLKPEQLEAPRPEKVAVGQPCGTPSARCVQGSVCVATADEPGHPREQCELLDTLVWRGKK